MTMFQLQAHPPIVHYDKRHHRAEIHLYPGICSGGKQDIFIIQTPKGEVRVQRCGTGFRRTPGTETGNDLESISISAPKKLKLHFVIYPTNFNVQPLDVIVDKHVKSLLPWAENPQHPYTFNLSGGDHMVTLETPEAE